MTAFILKPHMQRWYRAALSGGPGSSAAQALKGETNGLALSFTDTFFLSSTSHYGSARVKDTSTPGNNYNSHPFGLLTYSGASKKWVRGPSGLLIESDPALTLPFEWDTNGDLLGIRVEEQRTNLFLNNREPETQDITVTAQAYTLSFYGTGSITLSGAHEDTLEGTGENDRVELTFTPSAGTLTCTVSGTIDWVQLEAGSFATSPIETAGSTVTRAGDAFLLSESKIPWSDDEGTFIAEFFVINLVSSARVIGLAGFQTAIDTESAVQVASFNNSDGEQGLVANATTNMVGRITKVASSYTTEGRSILADGGSLVTGGSIGYTTPTNVRFGGRVGSSENIMHAYLRRIIYVPREMTEQEMQELTGA